MKRIDLGKGYVIDIDNMNRTLKKDVRTQISKETGEEYEASTIIGYYSTLKSAIRSFYEQKVVDTLEEKQTLKMAIGIMKQVKEEIDKQFEGIDMR